MWISKQLVLEEILKMSYNYNGDKMENYLLKFNKLPDNKLIKDMRAYAKENKVPIINDEGLSFLLFIIKTRKSKRILEIGSAIGFSSINMALMNEDIVIDTIERNEEMYNEAKKNIKKAKLDKRINLFLSDALEMNFDLLMKDYDFIFIDAAKAQYTKFFTMYEPFLVKGGFIFSDNLIFHGLVNHSELIESKRLKNLVLKIEKYNEWLAELDSYDTTFFSIGDGIAVSEKKND